MFLQRNAGATSIDIAVPIYDSSSAIGAKLTGLTFETASLTAHYSRQGASGAAVAITLITKTKGTWVSGGFVTVDGTNTPGLYELGLPDAALAAGAEWVVVSLKGAANMVPVTILIDLKVPNINMISATTGLLAEKADLVYFVKNTAIEKFMFKMRLSTDNSPAEDKTVTVTRSIDGGAFAAGALSAITQHTSKGGVYYFDFAAGDLNGDSIVVRCAATGCVTLDIPIRTR